MGGGSGQSNQVNTEERKQMMDKIDKMFDKPIVIQK